MEQFKFNNLKQIQHLEIVCNHYCDHIKMILQQFIHVTEFSLGAIMYPWIAQEDDLTILSRFTNLETLKLDTIWRAYDGFYPFLSKNMNQLKSLKLNRYWIIQQNLIDYLSEAKNLQYLDIFESTVVYSLQLHLQLLCILEKRDKQIPLTIYINSNCLKNYNVSHFNSEILFLKFRKS